ncbi:glucose-6-phosphate isomerase [Marivibrio halodurans]|uniref:glucose-6-phosphate isomerase n=1 Tax=Marivibrio halodurans TaxID=2039722 RepID=UPI001FED2329|nr:glucose-6-phosphate isomerase [Marivibrio halodurans]
MSSSELSFFLDALNPAMERLREAYRERRIPLLRTPERVDDWPRLQAVADRYRASFDDVVVLGTGGSSLGGRALYNMANVGFDDGDRRGPNLHIVTNIDPYSFQALLRSLDMRRTGFIAISKSGGTAETVLQTMTVLPMLERLLGPRRVGRAMTIVTEPKDNPMRRIAERYALPVLDHDEAVGGRYSVLTAVGMLPSLIAGLDARAVRDGAREVLAHSLRTGSPADCAPALGAAVAVGLERYHDIGSSVMLAYSDRLGSLARWYRQLWAESLGKEGKGTTPIYAAGPVDQHSQLQLWLDGPRDKMFTVLGGPIAPCSPPVDCSHIGDDRLDYLNGASLGELLDVSRRATTETLIANDRPVRTIDMAAIDERSMGALMMHYMLETILAADLLCVNPFDQPAVEHGKKLARRLLSARGEHRTVPASREEAAAA